MFLAPIFAKSEGFWTSCVALSLYNQFLCFIWFIGYVGIEQIVLDLIRFKEYIFEVCILFGLSMWPKFPLGVELS
jgi:hypothetical protein